MAKRIAYVGVLTALSLIAFLIENLFPPLFVPGAKLGLGNIFITLCLIFYSYPETLIAVTVKCVLSGILTGNFQSLIYGMTAGIVAVTVSWLLIRFFEEKISVVAVTSVSAVVHNLVQLGVFALITKSREILVYAPYLALLGLFAGIVTGLATYYLTKYIPRKFFTGENINRN